MGRRTDEQAFTEIKRCMLVCSVIHGKFDDALVDEVVEKYKAMAGDLQHEDAEMDFVRTLITDGFLTQVPFVGTKEIEIRMTSGDLHDEAIELGLSDDAAKAFRVFEDLPLVVAVHCDGIVDRVLACEGYVVSDEQYGEPGRFIVLELWPDDENIHAMIGADGEVGPAMFRTRVEAQKFADENCQRGYVVSLPN